MDGWEWHDQTGCFASITSNRCWLHNGVTNRDSTPTNQRTYIKPQVQFIIHCCAALYVPDVIPLPAGQPFTYRHVRLLNELLLVNLGQCIRQLFSDFGLCLSINGNRSQSKSEILDVRSYTVRVSLECPTSHRTLYHTLTWASCDFWRHAVTIFWSRIHIRSNHKRRC